MTKADIVNEISKNTGIEKITVQKTVEAFMEVVKDSLTKEKNVYLRGFGSFKVKHYDGYKGRNPKTGDVINVASKKLPFFKVGKELKERVDVY